MAGWRLEHTYTELPRLFFSEVAPTPVREPRLVVFNRALAVSIGLDADADNVLDPGETTTTTFVCNGVGADAGAPQIPCVGATDCPLTTSECTEAVCTNGFCAVANVTPGVVCSSVAMGTCNGNGQCVPFGSCGDGIINPPAEVCDDGNFVSGDGCSSCIPDVGFTCNGFPSDCRSRPAQAFGAAKTTT